jgi:hypothetical protein
MISFSQGCSVSLLGEHECVGDNDISKPMQKSANSRNCATPLKKCWNLRGRRTTLQVCLHGSSCHLLYSGGVLNAQMIEAKCMLSQLRNQEGADTTDLDGTFRHCSNANADYLCTVHSIMPTSHLPVRLPTGRPVGCPALMATYTKRCCISSSATCCQLSVKKGSAYIHDCAHFSMSSTSCLFSIFASCSGVCRRESF